MVTDNTLFQYFSLYLSHEKKNLKYRLSVTKGHRGGDYIHLSCLPGRFVCNPKKDDLNSIASVANVSPLRPAQSASRQRSLTLKAENNGCGSRGYCAEKQVKTMDKTPLLAMCTLHVPIIAKKRPNCPLAAEIHRPVRAAGCSHKNHVTRILSAQYIPKMEAI